jgi:hypothetical protein
MVHAPAIALALLVAAAAAIGIAGCQLRPGVPSAAESAQRDDGTEARRALAEDLARHYGRINGSTIGT